MLPRDVQETFVRLLCVCLTFTFQDESYQVLIQKTGVPVERYLFLTQQGLGLL